MSGSQGSRKQKVSFKVPEDGGRILEPQQTGIVSPNRQQDGALGKFLDYSRAKSQVLESHIVSPSSFLTILVPDLQPDKALWFFSKPAFPQYFLVKCLCHPPRCLLLVIAAMKLKDAYSLEGKL